MKDFFNNKKFLVCGGAGFMGSNFIHFLFKNFNGLKVINLDLLTYAGNLENLSSLPNDCCQFVKGDINDTNLVKKLMKQVDFVVNFAAETHVDRSIHGQSSDFIHTNIGGVHSLLEALRQSPKVSKMVQISTDEVWGDLDLGSKERFIEESVFKPNSPYAASKAAGDLLVRVYVKTYGAPAIVSHSVNNFGPRQFPEKLIPFFALRAINNEKLPLYGNGQNVRDWLYVDDHSTAVLTLLQKAKAGDVYAISRDEELPNIEIAKKILKILKKSESLITFVKDRPGHDRRYSVDSSKLRKLGWRPKYSFEKQFEKTINWYKENQNWLKGVSKKGDGINTYLKV